MIKLFSPNKFFFINNESNLHNFFEIIKKKWNKIINFISNRIMNLSFNSNFV